VKTKYGQYAQAIGKGREILWKNGPLAAAHFLLGIHVGMGVGVLGRVDPTGLAIMSARILILLALLAPIVILGAGILTSRNGACEPDGP